jgi:hypothetical protein
MWNCNRVKYGGQIHHALDIKKSALSHTAEAYLTPLLWFSEIRAVILLKIINRLVWPMETQGTFCAHECINITWANFMLQRLKAKRISDIQAIASVCSDPISGFNPIRAPNKFWHQERPDITHRPQPARFNDLTALLLWARFSAVDWGAALRDGLNPSDPLWPPYVPGVDSASDKNEYQRSLLGCKGGRCLGLTTLPPSCADCLKILGASTSWSHKGLFGPVQW